MAMSDPVISVRNLYFTYADETEALHNISLDVLPNQVFVLFGPSRAGKSTLLRLFNRLSDLTDGTQRQGTVVIDGRDRGEVAQQHGVTLGALYQAVSSIKRRLLKRMHELGVEPPE